MTTDRELLEWAAKAAGKRITGWNTAQGEEVAVLDDGSFWQPLHTNRITSADGDALRLAVKLRIELDHSHAQDQHRYVCASRRGCEMMYAPVSAVEEIEDEGQTLAATRRAIVRAAASIGQQKGE